MHPFANPFWLIPICCALISAAFWLVWVTQDRRGSSIYACTGFALAAVVTVFDLSRLWLPGALVIAIAPLHWLASGVLVQAFLHRFGLSLPLRTMGWVGVVPLAAHLYFFVGAPDLMMRNLISTLICGAIVVVALIRLRPHRRTALDRAIFGVLTVVAVCYLLRPLSWLGTTLNAPDNWLWSVPMLTLYLGNVLVVLAIALLLMLAIGTDLISAQVRESRRDALTGIGNRRVLEDAIHADGTGAAGYGAAIMIDLDHFKAINDRYGHSAGDAVLIAVAEALAAGPGRHAVLARVGGEEFALLVPADLLAAAPTLALVAQSTIAALSCPEIASPLTASAGLAVRTPGETLRDTLRRADMALYRAKAAGRNRLELAAGNILDRNAA